MNIAVIGRRPYLNVGGQKRVYFDTLDLSAIDLEDIAKALSHENRFGGQTPRPYSVLEHSLLVDWIYCVQMRELGTEAHGRVRLALLMHDAHESICKDMPSPLKKLLPDYRDLESRVELALHEHFGITRLMEQTTEIVKHYDLRACNTERVAFRFEPDSPSADWPSPEEFPPHEGFVDFLSYTTPAAPGLDRLRFMQYVWVRLVSQLLQGRV